MLIGCVMLTFCAGALAGCGATTASSQKTERVRTQISSEADSFTVAITAGRLNLVVGPPRTVSVRGTVTYRGDTPPTVTWEQSQTALSLQSVCPSPEADCGYNYTLTVPATMSVTVSDTAGDISATNLGAPTQLTATAGNISLAGLSGPLRVTGDAGNVVARNLRSGTTDVTERTGNVSLAFMAAPSQVSVRDSTGNVTVAVPTSASYHVVISVQYGLTASRVTDDLTSPRVIALSVGMGNVHLDQRP